MRPLTRGAPASGVQKRAQAVSSGRSDLQRAAEQRRNAARLVMQIIGSNIRPCSEPRAGAHFAGNARRGSQAAESLTPYGPDTQRELG